MKYKIEKILTILGIISAGISALIYWMFDITNLALAWGTASLWATNSLINLMFPRNPNDTE